MPNTKESFDAKLKSLNQAVSYQNVETDINTAVKSYSAAKTTDVGKVANQVKGGVQSLTSELKGVDGKLENPTASLLAETGGVSDKLKNNALNTGLGSLGASIGVSVTVNYTDSGSVSGISLGSGQTGSISSILAKITGLGAKPGFLQNIVSNASPEALKDNLTSLSGKVGAFSSVGEISSKFNAVKTDMMSQINAGVPSLDTNSQSYFDSFTASTDSSIGDISLAIPTQSKITENDLKNVLKEVSGSTTSDSADNVLNSAKSFNKDITNINAKVNQFDANVGSFVKTSSTGLLQGLAETVNDSGLNKILKENDIELTTQEKEKVIALSQGSASERAEAAEILSSKTKKENRGRVRSALENLDTTIAGTRVVNTANSAFEDPFDIDATGNKWNNGVGAKDFTFTFVSSVEELRAEIRKVRREITEVVVHWTDTFVNANIGSEEINDRHLGLGMDGIGYHYVIRRDGSLQRGRPVDQEGDHCHTNGHNTNSIGIVFVGGLNCASGNPNPTLFRSAASLTRSQLNTFEEFCRAFYQVNPGGQILGHNEIDPNEEDPGFEVIEYCKNVFGKDSLFDDPTKDKPFTRKELNAKRLT